MRSLLKLAALSLCLALGGAAALVAHGQSVSTPKKEESGKKKDKSKDKDKEKKKEKGKDGKTESGGTAGADKGGLNIPLVPGHDSKGLKIPYYGPDGKLQMIFNIGVASRLNGDEVRMSETQIETYEADGSREMTIDFPTSVLNMSTKVITSQTKTTIRRDDFDITGDAVEFNTVTKAGKLVGNVHMTIYEKNEEETAAAAAPKAPAPAAAPEVQ